MSVRSCSWILIILVTAPNNRNEETEIICVKNGPAKALGEGYVNEVDFVEIVEEDPKEDLLP